jgi:hypothetical protein
VSTISLNDQVYFIIWSIARAKSDFATQQKFKNNGLNSNAYFVLRGNLLDVDAGFDSRMHLADLIIPGDEAAAVGGADRAFENRFAGVWDTLCESWRVAWEVA